MATLGPGVSIFQDDITTSQAPVGRSTKAKKGLGESKNKGLGDSKPGVSFKTPSKEGAGGGR